MFDVNGMTITLTAGDTAAVRMECAGYTFGADDRAIFTLQASGGAIVMEQEHELEDGAFIQEFQNADTENWPAGSYSWDVRYVIGPYRDATGQITNGDQVITPMRPQTLTLIAPVGNV